MEKLSSTLFSMIFKSPLPFNDYNPPENQPFLPTRLSFTPRTKEKRSRFFQGKKKGRGIPSNSAYQPEIRIQFFRADRFRLRPRATHHFSHRHPDIPPPHPDVLFVARLPQNVAKPRRHICNKLRGCLDDEERKDRGG